MSEPFDHLKKFLMPRIQKLELTSEQEHSIHVQPYADMIDKLTYVQKADFAKRAIELERDNAALKKMFEEVSRERNAWISEYRSARAEVERTKQARDDFKQACDLLVVEKCHLEDILLRVWNQAPYMPEDLMKDIETTLNVQE